MGTNYYAETTYGDTLHLGKRSAGWRFAYHAEPGLFETFNELVGWLENTPCVVRDEYGQDTAPMDFVEMSKNWSPDGRAVEEDTHGYMCPSGYWWVKGEFS